VDQAAGLIDVQDPTWPIGLRAWKQENIDVINDPDICYLYVIIGFIQKQIIRKKYKKFDGSAKGGAYGVNVEGEVHMSTEEYAMDIRYGLTPSILKRPTTPSAIIPKSILGSSITAAEEKLFTTAQSVIFRL
jgi:hypothetical protein